VASMSSGVWHSYSLANLSGSNGGNTGIKSERKHTTNSILKSEYSANGSQSRFLCEGVEKCIGSPIQDVAPKVQEQQPHMYQSVVSYRKPKKPNFPKHHVRHDEPEIPETPNIALSLGPPIPCTRSSRVPFRFSLGCHVQLACVPRHVPCRLRIVEPRTDAQQIVR
jgi:hypothetical protein